MIVQFVCVTADTAYVLSVKAFLQSDACTPSSSRTFLRSLEAFLGCYMHSMGVFASFQLPDICKPAQLMPTSANYVVPDLRNDLSA